MTETSATPEPDHPTQLTDDALDVAVVAARAAEDKHGRDIVVLDVGEILSIVAYFVVLEAPNRRLVRTLVDEIEEAVRRATGQSPVRSEGAREQQWVLLDYGDVVVHVFLDEVRRFYEIERLYRDAPLVDWRDPVLIPVRTSLLGRSAEPRTSFEPGLASDIVRRPSGL